ncbi:sugar phosphate isomerase/epimerase family protein [uncultured Friedmanniella sp.]|uniref:sugar phosphate isomerase/epimerase family protein n=1 Tax=uncultured Friedmanniella sp. TaxID=335381 RepID=UPI0035C94EC8
MAELGVMTTEFSGSLGQVLDAVVDHGFRTVQLQLGSAVPGVRVTDALLRGLDVLGDALTPQLVEGSRAALDERGLRVAAVDGTYNMAHPDPERRRRNLQHLLRLIELAPALGTDVVTLCSGTRADIMWEHHPDSRTATAWDDLAAQLRVAVPVAERAGVRLAFEPEHNNVIDTAARARALIDQLGSPALGVVMDPANLFHRGDLERQAEHLRDAFALLGPDIVLAHAKDLDHDGDAGGRAAGCGLLDYRLFLAELAGCGFDGAVVLHQLSELHLAGAGVDRIGEATAHLQRNAPVGYLP